MKRLDIPKEFIPRSKELQEEHSAYEIHNFLKKNNAIQMFTTLGIDLYLTCDGRILVGDYFEDDDLEPREAKKIAEVALAVILGAEARNFPDLRTLLPERPETASECENCENKSGWYNLPGIGKFICKQCGGLVWIPIESG